MSQRIRFTICESTLGSVLIGAGKSGICAIFLGSNPGALEANLRRRFPVASLSYAGRSLEYLAAQVREAVELPGLDLRLALDPAGTPFQERV